MAEIVLLDTSVFLNVLDVPGFNQSRDQVLREFERRVNNGDHFLLPLASVWESGNHIAHLSDGRLRRRHAQRLYEQVRAAVGGSAPYRPTYFPSPGEFLAWMKDFPDYAQRSKSSQKTGEGTSLGDLSIIKEWERACSLHPMSRVRIWSLDQDLSSYDQKPRG